MKIAVIGCGTAGPAAALFLARCGHEVVVFERVPEPGPVGAGLLLQPTGMLALARLGLLERVLARGSRVERLRGTTVGGRVVIDLAYADLGPGFFGLGIHRGALFEVLHGALAASGIALRTGVEVASLDERADGVIVAGERFDRAVVADGARSRLRPPWARATPYPWGALWFVARSRQFDGALTQRYRDTRQFIGFLPSGEGLVSVFWSLRVDALERWRRRGLDAWRDEIHAIWPDTSPAVPDDQVEREEQVVFAPYFDVHLPRFHSDGNRVAWIGDAAHATSPQLGQGANLALLDAMVLADCDSPADFTARRGAHIAFYRAASRWLTPFFQSSFPILAPLRDLIAAPLHRWGWYRRQMLLSLAGVKDGIFTTLPDWPAKLQLPP